VKFDLSADELKGYLNSDSDGLLYWVISKDKIDVFENKINVSKIGSTVCKIR